MSEVKIVPTAKQKKGSLKKKAAFLYDIYLLVSDQKQKQMFMYIYIHMNIYIYISILQLSTCIFLYMYNMYVHVTVNYCNMYFSGTATVFSGFDTISKLWSFPGLHTKKRGVHLQTIECLD